MLNEPNPSSDADAHAELEELRAFIIDLHEYVGMIPARSEALMQKPDRKAELSALSRG